MRMCTDSDGTTSYKRAGAGVTSSPLKSTVSSTTTDYTPGISARLSGDSTFMHSGIKNADEQTDDNGDIAASRQYDAFGNLVATNGPWAGPFGYGGPYGYQTDPDHGLMLLGHRYYEADTGRFLTRDPIKDGRNWYVYCANTPLLPVDPEGLLPQWVERTWKWLKDVNESVGRIVRAGLKIITVVLAIVALIIAAKQAREEADEHRRYIRLVEKAVEGGLDIERGEYLKKVNNPGMGGPLRVMKRFWELVIEAFCNSCYSVVSFRALGLRQQ